MLVTYDEHDGVSAFGHGIAREGSAGTSTFPESVSIRAGDIEFASEVWHCAFEGRAQVSCAAAENRYAAVALTLVEATSAWQLKARFAANVTVAEAPPDAFHEHGLVLHANGSWRVPPEPGR